MKTEVPNGHKSSNKKRTKETSPEKEDTNQGRFWMKSGSNSSENEDENATDPCL